ncbi:MAG: hypothetical protein OXH86_09310 [Acidimicrobiaceae bacterium]|nr:hypothetical protein [Acidimicrobiaceae bacterium]
MTGGRRWTAAVAVLLLAAGLVAPVTAAGPAGAQTPPPPPVVDYDVDDDGLIEVSSLSQLNAIRWDLDGDGAADVYPAGRDGYTGHDPDGATKHAAAFPDAAVRMGCPSAGCDGYELTADLDFDTNGNGQADSGDEYWNDGRGWIPLIGGERIDDGTKDDRFGDQVGTSYYGARPHSRARMFTAEFEGNAHTIANLHIDDSGRHYVGLFGYVGPGAHVRNLGLSGPNSDAGVRGNADVGSLAGSLEQGRVSGVWSDIDVTGSRSAVGGLVGTVWRGGVIVESYSTGDVSGAKHVGGLVGLLNQSGVAAVFATGDVTASTSPAGGLVGYRPGGYMRAAYATGDVTITSGYYYGWSTWYLPFQNQALAGGLAGLYLHSNSLGTRATYSTGRVTVPAGYVGNGGLIGLCRPHPGDEPKASYWDTETSGRSSGECATGHTTAELQAPTGYEGIYSTWNLDIDEDGTADDPWDFGSSSEYPVFKYCAAKPGIDTADGLAYCPLQPDRQRAAVVSALSAQHDSADYRTLVDYLIEVRDNPQNAAVRGNPAHVRKWNRVLAAVGYDSGEPAMDASEIHDNAAKWSHSPFKAASDYLNNRQQPQPRQAQQALPVVSVTSGGEVTEGGTASFTVTASPAPAAGGLDVSVTVTATGDFGAVTGPRTVTIPMSGSAALSVSTTDDHADEADGSVTATLSAGTDYTVSSTQGAATVAVADNDGPDYTDYQTVVDHLIEVRDNPANTAVKGNPAHVRKWNRVLAAVGYASGEHAMPESDIHDNAAKWPHSPFRPASIYLTSQQQQGQPQQQTPPPRVVVPVVSVASGGDVTEGADATFTVTASPAPAADLDVTVTVTAAGEFGASTGARTVRIAPGQTTATWAVATVDDTIDEPDGAITATVVDVAGYDLGTPSTATVTVTDDDPPVVAEPDQPDGPAETALAACEGRKPTLSISSPQASRGDATVDFEVSLDCVPGGRVPVLLAPLRDGRLGENTLVALSADRTSAAVTVAVGTETRLGLTLVWAPTVKNRSDTTGHATYTD